MPRLQGVVPVCDLTIAAILLYALVCAAGLWTFQLKGEVMKAAVVKIVFAFDLQNQQFLLIFDHKCSYYCL